MEAREARNSARLGLLTCRRSRLGLMAARNRGMQRLDLTDGIADFFAFEDLGQVVPARIKFVHAP